MITLDAPELETAIRDLAEDRSRMHRRAQSAEGKLERARFWVRAIAHRGRESGDGYLVAIAERALNEYEPSSDMGKPISPTREPRD